MKDRFLGENTPRTDKNFSFSAACEACATLNTQQCSQGRPRVRLRHEMLTDEERVKPRGAKTRQISVRAQARFAYRDTLPWNFLDQFHRCLYAHFERAQVAVIHANNSRPSGQCPPQLFP